MSSFRKKYQPQFESPSKGDEPPVLLPPEVTAAELPPAVEPKPVEPMVESNPAEEAAQSALKQRLAEMERAESLQRQQQPPPQRASETQQQQPAMPAHVQEWLSRHPQYTDPNDQIAQAEINLATMKCVRDGLNWNDDNFIPSIERHLGIGNGQAYKTSIPNENIISPSPRHEAPPREPMRAPPRPQQQQRSAPPVSAPPMRLPVAGLILFNLHHSKNVRT